jgi:ABC-2 type transport system permease protein
MHMNGALFRKAMNDSKLLFAAIFVLMFGFPLVFLWASGMISLPAFSEFLTNALPRSWQRVWGVPISKVATPAGRAALVFVHPLVMSSGVVWAITRGSDCVSGEIGRGTMEMLLAQPVRRVSVYASQAIVTVAGSLLLAVGAWCGTAIGLRLSTMYAGVPAGLYAAPAINLFGLMMCVGGIAAFASSLDSQRWRTVGIATAVYVASIVFSVIGNISDRWNWVNYASFVSAYKPQTMVAAYENAWSLFAYRDGTVAGVGLGGLQVVLIALGVLFYALGAVIFCRREIPAPL